MWERAIMWSITVRGIFALIVSVDVVEVWILLICIITNLIGSDCINIDIFPLLELVCSMATRHFQEQLYYNSFTPSLATMYFETARSINWYQRGLCVITFCNSVVTGHLCSSFIAYYLILNRGTNWIVVILLPNQSTVTHIS